MRVWPFAQLNDWADRQRRSRELRIVATWEATTSYVKDDGKPTGQGEGHVVEFLMDGNGRRLSKTHTTNEHQLATHQGVMNVRYRWRVHGHLPDNAWRVDDRPRGNFVVIHGGKGAA